MSEDRNDMAGNAYPTPQEMLEGLHQWLTRFTINKLKDLTSESEQKMIGERSKTTFENIF